jgi:ABC-2 type transport system permease protein/lipopolysaccharide transport system permease protein
MIERLSLAIDELVARRSVFYQLVRQQLILRYRRTSLGYLWTLVNPLLMMSVMVVVFATLFKANLKDFAVFLVSGMIPWNCLNSIVSQSATAFIRNESLIKKIYLPKIIFPLSLTTGLFIDTLLSFLALYCILFAIGGGRSPAVAFLPLAFLLLYAFVLGLALVVSVTTVFFRDLQHVIQIAMQGLFFLTPVLYPTDALGGKVGWLVALNPVTPFIELFRVPLHAGTVPPAAVLAAAALIAAASLALGLALFLRQERSLVFRL